MAAAKKVKVKVKETAVKKTAVKTSKIAEAALPSAILKVGDQIPDFTLSSDAHGQVALRDFIGKKNVVLYFYPKDNTPGCTKEACAFQAEEPKFKKLNTVIIGVSPDSVKSHENFRKKYGLDFVLVSDDGHKLAEACGIWVLKQMYGRSYMGVQRATFLFNKKGIATHIWNKVSIEGHAADVLGQLS